MNKLTWAGIGGLGIGVVAALADMGFWELIVVSVAWGIFCDVCVKDDAT